MINDLRYAIRRLLKSPQFTVLAVLVLTAGIGANTAIFSLTNALLLRPLPGVEQPDSLVLVGRTYQGSGFDMLSFPDFSDLRHQATAFSGLAAYRRTALHGQWSRSDPRKRCACFWRLLRGAGRAYWPRSLSLARRQCWAGRQSRCCHQRQAVERVLRLRFEHRRRDNRLKRNCLHRGRHYGGWIPRNRLCRCGRPLAPPDYVCSGESALGH